MELFFLLLLYHCFISILSILNSMTLPLAGDVDSIRKLAVHMALGGI